jgi:hypothetical protein
MELDPCKDYTVEVVEGLWGGRESLTLVEICDLDVPAHDRIWAVTQLMPEREARLFAADCAESVLHIYETERPKDARPRKAIAAARAYANGEIGEDKLSAVWYDPWVNARLLAGWYAAWWAAWDAVWGPARDAAGSAARGDGAAEREKQIANLRNYCEEIENAR